MHARDIWGFVARIRQAKPLVVSITNYIVANANANALLALGASPVMSSAEEETAELASIGGAVVINLGSLNDGYVRAMHAAGTAANAAGTPVVLDPVACGATTLRREASSGLLEAVRFAAVRGNASEIIALAGAGFSGKGVDSTQESAQAVDAAKAVAQARGCVVCVSGAADYVTDGARVTRLLGGHAMMTAVTGMGCTATALLGAFCAVAGKDHYAAAVAAMAAMKVAGGLAAEGAAGPGELQVRFYDALWNLDEAAVAARLELEAL